MSGDSQIPPWVEVHEHFMPLCLSQVGHPSTPTELLTRRQYLLQQLDEPFHLVDCNYRQPTFKLSHSYQNNITHQYYNAPY